MGVYNLSPIFKPQYIANAAAKLVMAPALAVAAGNVVPPNFQYLLNTVHVINITSAPVSLKLWRVPSGAANDDEHIVVPVTVLVPIASSTFPQFDVTALWGAVLAAGDSIYGIAGAASSLVIEGDGAVIQL